MRGDTFWGEWDVAVDCVWGGVGDDVFKMMELLDQPLVKKYFECEDSCFSQERAHLFHFTYNVLKAMSAPIKKHERYLSLEMFGETKEMIYEKDISFAPFHPYDLRLPDSSQPKQECDGALVCSKCQRAPGYTCRMPVVSNDVR